MLWIDKKREIYSIAVLFVLKFEWKSSRFVVAFLVREKDFLDSVSVCSVSIAREEQFGDTEYRTRKNISTNQSNFSQIVRSNFSSTECWEFFELFCWTESLVNFMNFKETLSATWIFVSILTTKARTTLWRKFDTKNIDYSSCGCISWDDWMKWNKVQVQTVISID